jgi:hypothetical protein
MAFNHKYNTDDSILRANIVGLVNELNNRIFFENVWEDGRKETVRVPFFYAMSGDERFLQDYFSNWNDCAPDFIEGNTDPIPRGTIYLSGYSVLASNLTSRYVRGYYTKETEEGELKRFNSYINSIPVQMNFTGEILTDTSIDSFKIVQAITAYLYRTQVFSVNFMGFRVPTQVGFPDSYNIGKQFEFTYGNTERIKVTFDLELQSYLPVVDPENIYFAGNQVTAVNPSFRVGGDPSESTPFAPLPTYSPSIEETNITRPPDLARSGMADEASIGPRNRERTDIKDTSGSNNTGESNNGPGNDETGLSEGKYGEGYWE